MAAAGENRKYRLSANRLAKINWLVSENNIASGAAKTIEKLQSEKQRRRAAG